MASNPYGLPPKTRARRPVERSTRGCLECRRSKVKCDESRPSCARCMLKGFQCSGPIATGKVEIRWSSRHERWHARPKSHDSSPSVSGSIGNLDLSRRPRSSPDPIHAHLSIPPSPGGSSSCSPILERQTPEESFKDTDEYTLDDRCDNTAACWLGAASETQQWWHIESEANAQAPIQQQVPCFADVVEELTPHWLNCATRSGGAMSSVSEYAYPANAAVMAHGLPPVFWEQPISLHRTNLQLGLVKHYFESVCTKFSTFDLQLNPFRSRVAHKWQSSPLIFYTLLSMSAAKLNGVDPIMLSVGLTYQGLAFRTLKAELARFTVISIDAMLAILMLGLSTAWHDLTDLGICHLRAAQNAFSRQCINFGDAELDTRFYKQALIYWDMSLCLASDEVPAHVLDVMYCHEAWTEVAASNVSSARIMPHPWTGISSVPQMLFAITSRCARRLQKYEQSMEVSRSSLNAMSSILSEAESLEQQVWNLRLPTLEDIESTGDSNTPAIHHLLLAEAYLLATLHQLYFLFPDKLRDRRKSIATSFSAAGQICQFNTDLQDHLGLFFNGPMLPVREIVKRCGSSVITRLEQIHIKSGTSCVQTLLLVATATSLTIDTNTEDDRAISNTRAKRQFILNRLDLFEAFSFHVGRFKVAVVEIFRLLDAGENVFWIDVFRKLGLETVIG